MMEKSEQIYEKEVWQLLMEVQIKEKNMKKLVWSGPIVNNPVGSMTV